jgi:pyruvate-formate lyase-activating enzyme
MRAADGLRVLRPGAGANPLRPGRELLVTFSFRCNLACRFCYVEDGLGGRFRGVTLEEAHRLLTDPRLTAGVTRIIFSGGEVTLDKDLPRYAALARAVPTVEHVRIQTNATRLDDDLVARLTAAGVDEYFVSLHGATAATCDAVTAVPGSFTAITAGVARLVAAGASVITNTVVCAANVDELPAIIALAAELGAGASELWGYVPRVDAADARALLVPVAVAAPPLQRAVATGLARGLAMTVKYFPRCLLGEVAHVHSDAQPRLIIDDAFWHDHPRYGCWYGGVCAAAASDDGCSGLPDAYVRRFGWEEDRLRPFVDDRGAPPAPPFARYHGWAAAPSAPATPPPVDWDPAPLGLALGGEVAGFRLTAAERDGDRATLRFVDERGGLAIALAPRASGRDGFARTASLVLTHPLLTPAELARARPLLDAVAAALTAVDRGQLAAQLTAPPPPTAPLDLAAGLGLRAAADALIAAGLLDARAVEPSFTLGAPHAVRWLVNPSIPGPARDPAGLATALLTAIDPSTPLVGLARAWLGAGVTAERIAFVGEDRGAGPPRAKLYLATPTAALARAAHALVGGPPPADATTMIAVDARGAAVIAHKHYAPLTAAAARAAHPGDLLALLDGAGLLLGELPLLEARRFTADGETAPALHVDVARFAHLDLGAAWARASGDRDAAERITASGRPTRVVSATRGAGPRHVYLGGRDA